MLRVQSKCLVIGSISFPRKSYSTFTLILTERCFRPVEKITLFTSMQQQVDLRANNRSTRKEILETVQKSLKIIVFHMRWYVLCWKLYYMSNPTWSCWNNAKIKRCIHFNGDLAFWYCIISEGVCLLFFCPPSFPICLAYQLRVFYNSCIKYVDLIRFPCFKVVLGDDCPANTVLFRV